MSGSLFKRLKRKIEELLSDFGPNRKTHAIHPYLRLRTDGIWTFNKPDRINTTKSARFLIDNGINAGFSSEVKESLTVHPDWIPSIAQAILDDNFPPSLHQDILNACALEMEIGQTYALTKSKQRDPAFREKILQAYSYQCAICGFKLAD